MNLFGRQMLVPSTGPWFSPQVFRFLASFQHGREAQSRWWRSKRCRPCRAQLLGSQGSSLPQRSCSRGQQQQTQRCSSHLAAAAQRSKRDSKEYTTQEFHDYFEAQFGERWLSLYTSLASPTRHVALVNPFLGRPLDPVELPGSAPLSLHLSAAASGGRPSPPLQVLQYEAAGGGYPPPSPDPSSCLLPWYWMDCASLVPPLALGVAPGHSVLDMCAAPGGKSLVLAQLLWEAASEAAAAGATTAAAAQEAAGGEPPPRQAAAESLLVCNEINPGRRRRLVGVLRAYLPEHVRQSIGVTPHDATSYWQSQEAETYDRIQLDAPCSSDRHIVQQAASKAAAASNSGGGGNGGGGSVGGLGEILKADWSVKRCKAIAGDQAKLLAAAVKALKPGGRLVYSTCSIASCENDEVIDKVLSRAGAALQVASHSLGAEVTTPAAASTALAAKRLSAAEAAGGSLQASPQQQQQQEEEEEVGLGSEGLAAPSPLQAPSACHLSAADFEAWGAERTRHGWLFLPDASGWGPMYVAVLHKVASTDLKRVKVNKYRQQGQ